MKTHEQLRAEDDAIRNVLARGPERSLRGLPGVLHVSVGLKEKEGRLLTDQLCIRVYVRQKRSRHDLPAAELIPADIDGIQTDVNTVADFEFQADNTRYRPIKGGIQITNGIVGALPGGTGTQISRGTLGCVAIDNTDKSEVLLSNWHVLEANAGTDGDKVFQPAPSWLPTLQPGQLPFRPTDDTDKIAVVRRSRITEKVDAAIARIDVSSCCRCCGIRYSNEIKGLSVGGRPARNTLVGDERAVAGMTVFKVGQSTLRTEGIVVDPNYPTFSIQYSGAGYIFTGQIAIQNIDQTQQFSDVGDSGALVVNLDNKVVGLVFAAGKDVAAGGAPQPFITLANHFADVLTALNIRVAYSPDVVVTSGGVLADVPPVVGEAPIPLAYRAFRDRLQSTEATAVLLEIGQLHSDEITNLVNHCRPVTVAWHRCQGPALLAALMGAVRDGRWQLPERLQGVALHEALERMRAVLSRHGSPALRESLSRPEADVVIEANRRAHDLNEVIERIVSHRAGCRGGGT